MTTGQTKSEPGEGILTDAAILEAAKVGRLVSDGFASDQLDGCAYEFRVGRVGYTYDYPNMRTRRYEADQHTIYPFETVTIVTVERVYLDRRHYLSLLSKGSLFSLGLSVVCTAADPGFRGHLGITFTNMGTRPVVLPYGTGFVKGVFYRLDRDVERHYVGQHGDAMMSWPYPSQFHTEPLDFDQDDSRCWSYLPPPVLDSFRRLRDLGRYMKWIVGAFSVLVVLNVSAQFLQYRLSPQVYSDLERYIGLVGAFASIAGLALSVTLMFPRKRGGHNG